MTEQGDHRDEDAPDWAEHAEELRGQQQALAMLRAMMDPDDEEPFLQLVGELAEMVEGEAGVDVRGLERYHVGLAEVAIHLGRRAHGDQLDEALAEMQQQLAEHIAEYEP